MSKDENLTQEQPEPCFVSLRAVLIHLERSGYKISQSKIYRDKNKGLIQVRPDGKVPKAEARAYAATLEHIDGHTGDIKDIQVRKKVKEADSLDLKVEKQRWELDRDQGQYMPIKDFHTELAARAVIFETGMKHCFNMRVGEWVALVGGKPERAPDLLQEMIQPVEQELNSYANPQTFHVVIER